MGTALFKKFCKLAYDKAGITLKPGKESLVRARVAKRQRALGIGSPREYLGYLEADESGEELVQFLDVISTNFTHFMREKDHFEELTREVHSWLAAGRQRIRMWCAASSSGEEPYSTVITILDALDGKKLDFKLLATDISTRVLARARAGQYDGTALEALTKAQRIKYFAKKSPRSAENTLYEAKPEVKQHLVFKRLNLAEPPFPMKGPLDVVMCRNVMIYFDHAVRQRLISEIDRLTAPNGLFITGHSETLAGIHSNFELVRPSVYRKASR